ncbi:lipid A core-O-antigen ligase [Photobacterium aphoticum]|uniref:Lipid A core-O-antigen ligase n=1 Tax=Photobacterium aphoticum TaxID=754436 RepID=A0A090QT40_9GAMM|nr:lipid A core-O-antigen ligase [Photobacterium aphoticum]
MVGLFFPITLHTQLEYPFYHSLPHWIVFIILIHWVDNLTAKYYRKSIKHLLPLRMVVLLLPVAITSYMATTLYSGYLLTKYETTQPINIDYLLKVNNPWAWHNRFEWDLHVTQLQIGTASQNPAMIEEYIRWAQEKAKIWPRPDLYKNLISAYLALEKTSQAEQIYQEALYLFPAQAASWVTHTAPQPEEKAVSDTAQ